MMLKVSQKDATKIAFMEALKSSNEAAILWVAIRPPDGQAAPDMATTLENIETMLLGGDLKRDEITQRYDNFIEGRIKAQQDAEAGKVPDGAGQAEGGAEGADATADVPADLGNATDDLE